MIYWKDVYSVGVVKLDEEHKDLIESINIVDELYYSNKEEAIPKLEEINRKLVNHTFNEDEYMISIKYPNRNSHVQRHTEILENFDKHILLVKRSKTEEEYHKAILRLSIFMRDDILLHSLGEDREYHIWQSSKKLS